MKAFFQIDLCTVDTYEKYIFISLLYHKLDMFDLLRGFTFQVMANGTLSVDSFFFMRYTTGIYTLFSFVKHKSDLMIIKQNNAAIAKLNPCTIQTYEVCAV